ncbi:M14 family zinc carboxypeptidase [Luteimonas sp. RD2P54]|uniref:M14 family zinc carboxypeptidase n=1 Tax=Luteimonas endophytica TaxID=3042023 RepID=A0ABT6J7L3_9GAMM|nr:M14 family zinc carboxypeptidase [Luteimonas endophytica]MDH5822804.1 M14 family zinc carboxypeptidase [Luteimonas endophytica]
MRLSSPLSPLGLFLAALAGGACAHASGDPGRAPHAIAAPAPPAWLDELARRYDGEYRALGLETRMFSPEQWWRVATPLLARDRGFTVAEAGRSAEGRPLRHVAWGEGATRVLLWSQMHGDESTASMALADLFRFLGEHPTHPLVERLRREATLHFLPVMNPDGAARFQRRNAQGIDINRDARALASPEARALKSLRDRVRPAFGFNLHDQRVGYRAGDSERGVAIALLAPPYDASGGVNPVRARAIEVAAVMRTALEPYIAGRIARWDDSFNPRAFGDLMTQWGTSTVLVESGGIEGDPQKQVLRKLNFLALAAALDAIASGSHAGTPQALYAGLPENGEVWPDLLIEGGVLAAPGVAEARVDLLVKFEHPLLGHGGEIADVGDLAGARARRVIDASGLFIVPIAGPGAAGAGASGSPPAPPPIGPGEPARFHLSRDPQGRDIVWTLAEDLDPAHRYPATVGERAGETLPPGF